MGNKTAESDDRIEAVKRLNAWKVKRIKLLETLETEKIQNHLNALSEVIEKLRFEHEYVRGKLATKRGLTVKASAWAIPSKDDIKDWKTKKAKESKEAINGKPKRAAKGPSLKNLDPAQKLYVNTLKNFKKLGMDNAEELAKSQVEKLTGKPLNMEGLN